MADDFHFGLVTRPWRGLVTSPWQNIVRLASSSQSEINIRFLWTTASLLCGEYNLFCFDISLHISTMSEPTHKPLGRTYWCLDLPHQALCSSLSSGLSTCISRASRPLEKLCFVPTLRWLSSALSGSFCLSTLHISDSLHRALREEYLQALASLFFSFRRQCL